MKFAKIMITAVCLAASTLGHAACTSAGCFDVRITRLYVNTDNVVYIDTDGDESVLQCSLVSNVYITLDNNDSEFQTVFSTMLAAQLADKPVSIVIAAGSSNCKIRYVTLDSL